jgi:hypothetical protein
MSQLDGTGGAPRYGSLRPCYLGAPAALGTRLGLQPRWASRRHLAALGAFICVAYCGSFRGSEVFMVDCAGL